MPPPSPDQVMRDVDLIEARMSVAPGGRILDVACGAGRHAVELSKRGYEVVGLDLSLEMLARASEQAVASGAFVNFLHGDMREMAFEATFDGVFCVGSSFGFFDDDGNREVLRRVRRALKPGGVLLIEVPNRDHGVRGEPHSAWFAGDACMCVEESNFNFISSRLHVRRQILFEEGRQRVIEYDVRLYSLHELGGLLHKEGFRVIEAAGHLATPGAFFGEHSARIILLAELDAGAPK